MRPSVYPALALAVIVLVAGVAAPVASGQAGGSQAPRAEADRTQADRARARAARDRAQAERRVLVLDGSYIGVTVRDVETDGAAKPDATGAVVEEVSPDGPAAKAGVKPGDVIVEFDGERVRGARQLTRLVRETPEGHSVRATVLRGGARQTVTLTPSAGGDRVGDLVDRALAEAERGLRDLPRGFSFDFDAVPPAPPRPPAAPRAPRAPRRDMWFGGSRLGASVQPLTSQLATYFGAKAGVLVSDVADGSAAAKAGLKAGDVITSIDGHAVGDPGDVLRELRGAAGREVSLAIVRDRKPQTLKATIERRSRARSARPA